MTFPETSKRSGTWPGDAFSRTDPLGQALRNAVLPQPMVPLAPGFAKRVAEIAQHKKEIQIRRDRKLIAGFVFSILGLMFLGLIGWQVFRPSGLVRLFDGPLALVLTAIICLVLGARIAKPHKPILRKI